MEEQSEGIPQEAESPAVVAAGVDPLEDRKRRQREAVHRYQRKKRLEQRRFVTPEQLAALRADPQSCKGVCRNCGQILKDVGPHLGHCPAGPMNEAEYKAKWGFPLGGNATRSDEKQQSYKRPETSAGIQRAMEAGRAVQSERYKIARREWDVIALRVNGRSILDIATEDLKFATRKPVRTAVRSVDLPKGMHYQCDRGQPFTRGSGVELYKMLNLDRPDFARLVSTPAHAVRERRIVIWYTKRRCNMDPIEARACMNLRDRVAKTVLGQDTRGKRDSYDRREVLGALFPRYREEYKMLGRTLRAIGAFLKEKPEAEESDVGTFVIDQAQAEKRGELDTTCFRELIPWLAERAADGKEAPKEGLPKLMPAILAHRAAIVGTNDPHRVAVGILADTMGVPAKILLDAITEQIEPASPEKMRYVLRAFPQFTPAALPKTPRKPGPKPKADSEKEQHRISARVNGQIPGLKRLIEAIGQLPNKIRGDKEKARERLREKVRKGEADFAEDQIAAVLDPTITDNPATAARRLVSATEVIEYDTVARYHRAFPEAGLNSPI